jgi:hypothetical protein
LIESKALAKLGDMPLPDLSNLNDWCSVRTPKLYHFDSHTNTQIQEYLPSGIDLKNYALKYYEPHTSPTKKAQCLGLGRGLGQWLKEFHEFAEQSSDLRKNAAENRSLQRLKHSTYYDYLILMIDKFPEILSQAKGIFESVKVMSEKELDDDSVLQAVHGDFWTGK